MFLIGVPPPNEIFQGNCHTITIYQLYKYLITSIVKQINYHCNISD